MRGRLYIVIGLLACAMGVQARSYTATEVPNPKEKGQEWYVADPEGLLADSTVRWLNHCAALLEAETKVEMATVALRAIEGKEAFDFAYELFQRWGIGKKGQNTGVLVLFVRDSHDLRIMTGTGIEGVLTDAQCSRIMHEEMFPAFRAGDYDAGLCRGAIAIYEVCTDGDAPEELRTIQSVTNRGQYGQEEEEWTSFDTAILIVVLILIVVMIWLSNKSGNHGGKNGGSSYGGGWYGGGFGGGSSFGGGSFGGGSTFGGGAGGKW